MPNRPGRVGRMLAVDFSSRGFGFVVLEPPCLLVDWGAARARGRETKVALRRLDTLLSRYEPRALVLEDVAANPRRGRRVRGLTRAACQLALARGVRTRLISPTTIRRRFQQQGANTKHQIATAIAGLLPEIAPRLPPKRKPWMSEAESMGIFDAVALALTTLPERPRPPAADKGKNGPPAAA